MNKTDSNSQKFLFHILLIAASSILLSSSCQSPSEQNILIVTGGHDFEREAFFQMFVGMPGINYREVIHPEANQLYDSSLMDEFDVLVFYDMAKEIDDAQKTAFIKLLEQGKGMVFLHHSLASYQEWAEIEKIIGGRYMEGSSTYKHDVEVPVSIVSKDHPITRDVDDFVIFDEVYGNFMVLPDVQAILKTTHPESGDIIGWAHQYGNSRIVYLQLGHDHHAYENPNYRRLVKQAIDWVQ